MRKVIIMMLVMIPSIFASDAFAKIKIEPPPEVPTGLYARGGKYLVTERKALMEQFTATQNTIDRQAENCLNVEEGSPKERECEKEIKAVQLAVREYRGALKYYREDIDSVNYDNFVINGLNAMAGRLNWDVKARERLDKTLRDLGPDGDKRKDKDKLFRLWQELKSRDQNGELAREAAQGEGPGIPGAGKQSFEDCTVFALANASGQPYGVVAAQANALISDAEWRSPGARDDSQLAIEQRGLMGGEVVFLAESLGQAEVVRSGDFAKTLKEGRPVLIRVLLVNDPENKDRMGTHQVVLTKSFKHGPNQETWYEMMDSNQAPQKRLYLSKAELNAMLLENGVTYRPESHVNALGTTPQLLR